MFRLAAIALALLTSLAWAEGEPIFTDYAAKAYAGKVRRPIVDTVVSQFDPTNTNLSAAPRQIAALKKRVAELEAGNPAPSPVPPPTGWPDASNTGAKGTLTPYSGPKTITAANVTIENKTITGSLRVTGANFTLKNCKLTYSSAWGIDAEGAVNPTIQDSTIVGPGSAGAANSGFLGSGTLLRNDFSKAENGIVLQGGKSVVKGNFIHDLLSSAGNAGHYDGISVQGGQNGVLIEDNAIYARDTSDVFVKNDFGNITDVTVNHNYLGGNPGINVYVDGRGPKGVITNIKITNNVLTGAQFPFSIDNSSPVISGNVDLTGKPV